MYFSLYNDNKFDTKNLFFKNLIKSPHTSITVRTPPNKFHTNFIGELNIRKKPILFYNSFKSFPSPLINCKNNNKYSSKIKIKAKSYNLPKLLIANNNNSKYNKKINTDKNIYLKRSEYFSTNNLYNNGMIIDLNFPYCNSILKTSKSNYNIHNKYKIKNKALKTIKIDNINNINNNINNKSPKRLFFKSFSNFHEIIKKIKKEDKKENTNNNILSV